MSYNRVSDIPQLKAEEHYSFLTTDKLWLFSRKFHDQPTYHSGQRVTHKGGYSIYFDLKTQKWSEVEEFNALTTEEHIDELMFVHENRICCLLYSNLGKIQFLQLAVFDETERQFTMWNEFENISSIKASVEDETYKQRLILADGILGDKSLLFIASIEGDLHFFKLFIDFSAKQSSITPAAKYPSDKNETGLLMPINAAIKGDQVVIEYAHRGGCIVRWEAARLDSFSIEGNDVEKLEIQGTPPNFSFLGAKLTSLLSTDEEWLHFGGNIQKGMTGREFNGEVWSLEKTFSKNPEWKKLEGFEIPKEAENAEFAFDPASKTLYIIDTKNGLFTSKL